MHPSHMFGIFLVCLIFVVIFKPVKDLIMDTIRFRRLEKLRKELDAFWEEKQ